MADKDQNEYAEYLRTLSDEELENESRKIAYEKEDINQKKRSFFLLANKYNNQLGEVIESEDENKFKAFLAKMEDEGIPRDHAYEFLYHIVENLEKR